MVDESQSRENILVSLLCRLSRVAAITVRATGTLRSSLSLSVSVYFDAYGGGGGEPLNDLTFSQGRAALDLYFSFC